MSSSEGPPVDLEHARLHFAGVGGAGMSALAQFQAMRGIPVTGSDRDFDRGAREEIRAALEKLGVTIHPQDGSGVEAGPDALVVSTAVEDDVPDLAIARQRGVPVIHRAELLAWLASGYRTIAVAGSSGKSTVVSMIFEILRATGGDPSVVTGGNVLLVAEAGWLGNAWWGGTDLMVLEADESDGSLVRYEAEVGVLLNLHRDHKELDELESLFATFRDRTRRHFVISDGSELASLRAPLPGRDAPWVFGDTPEASVRVSAIEMKRDGSSFVVEHDGARERMTVPLPGRFNVENTVAAIAACLALAVPLSSMIRPVSGFCGVARRFQSIGQASQVEVIDDFAHNPRKIKAALAAADRRAKGRVLAVFQPHGYGPARFMRRELGAAFTEALRPGDRLWMLEIYDAGGSARRDLSAADLVRDIEAPGCEIEVCSDRSLLPAAIAAAARPGDLVLVMGARDPSLTALCREILAALK